MSLPNFKYLSAHIGNLVERTSLFEPFSIRHDLHVDLCRIFFILESYGSVTNRRDPFHWYFLDQKFVLRYGNTYSGFEIYRSKMLSELIDVNIIFFFGKNSRRDRYYLSIFIINLYILSLFNLIITENY